MISASQHKFITSLHVKKYRQKYRNFLVEGEKMVGELLRQKRIGIVNIFGTERWYNTNAALMDAFSQKFHTVTENDLKKIGTLVTPNQVLAVAELPPEITDYQPDLQRFTLFLDGIQDPGNMGTIIRTADWFGMETICCGPGCVDIFSPKVVQSAMGSLFRLNIVEDMTLQQLTATTPLIPVYGAVMNGENLFKLQPSTGGIVVIGNEGRGIQEENQLLLTHRVTIPRHLASEAESLNAGVAAAIFMAEIMRLQIN